MQNDELGAMSDAELRGRLDTAKARLDLMEAQLEDIRDEGREETPVYQRIDERRRKLDAERQRLAAEASRRPSMAE